MSEASRIATSDSRDAIERALDAMNAAVARQVEGSEAPRQAQQVREARQEGHHR
jgi:hypothetical protein